MRMTTPARPLLEVDELSTSFLTAKGVATAVDKVSFSVARGETLGIVGESGSGKSVLVRTIMGLLPPRISHSSGVVRYDGTEFTPGRATSAARRLWGTEIAMVFQDPLRALNPTKKVGEHIMESLRRHLRMGRGQARARAIELLDLVGIPDPARRVDQYPHQLSGGMRQRVTIAIALAGEPRLLIADEPTTALDVTVQKQILDLLGDLQREKQMTMLLITHDLGVVAGRTDSVAVMYAGRLVETGPTAQLFADTSHPYTSGLLRSIPRTDQPSHQRLEALAGRPPNIADLPAGCRFAPRCDRDTAICHHRQPSLEGGEHSVACWHPLTPVQIGAAPAEGPVLAREVH